MVCRTSPSFLRFAQMELFAQRGEKAELLQLANHLLYREYPLLLQSSLLLDDDNAGAGASADSEGEGDSGSGNGTGNGNGALESLGDSAAAMSVYVDLYRCVGGRAAHLVTEWLRVGYCQGNMNSDNTLLGGRTLDYGPYGWVERYDPLYQPFTSDGDLKFAFMRQVS